MHTLDSFQTIKMNGNKLHTLTEEENSAEAATDRKHHMLPDIGGEKRAKGRRQTLLSLNFKEKCKNVP